MKPFVCVCCGERISSKSSPGCGNPNVCRPCEYLVETGTIPALRELIDVLTDILMRKGAQHDVPLAGLAGSSPSNDPPPRPPTIHAQFLKPRHGSGFHSGAWRN